MNPKYLNLSLILVAVVSAQSRTSLLRMRAVRWHFEELDTARLSTRYVSKVRICRDRVSVLGEARRKSSTKRRQGMGQRIR